MNFFSSSLELIFTITDSPMIGILLPDDGCLHTQSILLSRFTKTPLSVIPVITPAYRSPGLNSEKYLSLGFGLACLIEPVE